MLSNLTHRPLGEIFRTTVLTWSRAGELAPVVAGGAVADSGEVTVRALKGARGAAGKRPRFSLGDTEWPELGLHSYLYPCLMCVVEGEADIRIGERIEGEGTGGRGGGKKAGGGGKGSRGKGAAAGMEVWVYGLPAKTCLIVPPGVPYSDGKTPHWEREDAEAGRSQILWLQILPTGAILHLCQTEGRAHTHSSALFIKDAQLSVLAQFMVERTAHADAADAGAVLRSYLNTLLLCVEQNWDSGRIIDSDEIKRFAVTSEQRGIAARDTSDGTDAHGATLERACRYIQSHLTDAMTPEQIARHAFVSVPQLKRIFRARLDTPVMKYVTGRRIEEAKALLLGTGLNVDEIGFICGYPHRTHFSRAFKAHCGVSPQGFRRGTGEGSRQRQ